MKKNKGMVQLNDEKAISTGKYLPSGTVSRKAQHVTDAWRAWLSALRTNITMMLTNNHPRKHSTDKPVASVLAE